MSYQRWWTVWGIFLGILFAVSLALRYNLLFVFTTLVAVLSGMSVLWFRYCLYGVTYRRRLDEGHIFHGEETQLTVEVTNAKPLPMVWLDIRDEFPHGVSLLTGALEIAEEEPDQALQREMTTLSLSNLLSLRWYERIRRTYRIRGGHRGLYLFGPAVLTSSDVLGFGRKFAYVQDLDRLVVYPKVVPVEQLGLPFEVPSGEFRAKRRIVEDPLRMATVREYVPGDSIRHIHWKNTARLNRLQTKVFDPSSGPTLVIFVDLQTSHQPYSLVREYLELIITAAASIAVHALATRYAVGLYVNGAASKGVHWTMVSPGRNPGQAVRILEALAPLVGFREVPFHQLLHRSMSSLPYGSTVMPITAQPTEAVLVSLLALRDAGHPVVLLTVGDQEAQVPETFESFHLGGRDAWNRLETLVLA